MNERYLERVIASNEWRWVGIVTMLVLAATFVPILWAYATTPSGIVYSGFIYGWDDGSSYLATMRLGARGEWLYTLPYSADPGQSFFLFIHYLLLGQIAGWLRSEPIIVFHLARLAGGALLCAVLYRFISRNIQGIDARRVAFLLALLSSGLGWVAVLAGHTTPDLWQAEAFPYLSILANVHFPWAMAAFLWLLDWLTDPTDRLGHRDWILLVLSTVVLANIQPYALVILGITVGLFLATHCWLTRKFPAQLVVRAILVGLCAAPFALYYRWALLNISSYAGWEQQDITLSAPVSDYLIAFGLPLLVAISLCVVSARDIARDAHKRLLVYWMVTSTVLIYLPFAHQRRFAFGMFIPIALLAAVGLKQLALFRLKVFRNGFVTVASFTNLILLLVTLFALTAHTPTLYFTSAEWAGLMFLRTQAQPGRVVLSSPEMGLFIPAWTDQRVVYGHPNETLNAVQRRQDVEAFFSGRPSAPSDLLATVEYIYLGPREKKLGSPPIPPGFAAIFTDADVTILARQR